MSKKSPILNERRVMLCVFALYVVISIAIVVSMFLPDMIALVTCVSSTITDAVSTIVSLYSCQGETMKKIDKIPFWEKYTLTIREAAEYFHLGEDRVRLIVKENPHADFILMNGKRILIKKKLLEKYIDSVSEIRIPTK